MAVYDRAMFHDPGRAELEGKVDKLDRGIGQSAKCDADR